MEKEFEFKGYFWLPSKPDEQFPGTMKFNQTIGINLEIFGHFEERMDTSSKGINIILGITSNGKQLTILNCYEYSRTISSHGFPHSSIRAIYLFIGKHFNLKEELQFDYMKISYEDINYWLDITGFERPFISPDKKEVAIKYKKPDSLSYTIQEGWKLNIDFTFLSTLGFFVPLEKVEVKQKPEVVLEPEKRKNFEEFNKTFETLNSFLSLCYFTYPKIEFILFYLKKENLEDELDEPLFKIELFFKHGISYQKYKQRTCLGF